MKPLRDDKDLTIALAIDDLKYDVFSLFILAVLWRASVSNVFFFRRVHLGPYEETIRELLWDQRAPPPERYAAILGTSLSQQYPNTILRPDECRFDDEIHCWRLYFPNIFAHVKTDRRCATEAMTKLMIQPRKTNYIICFPYHNSPYPRFFEGMKSRLRTIGRVQRGDT
jgi:hypothetical protein